MTVKEQQVGIATAEVCRRHGISGATCYEWKSKCGGRAVFKSNRLLPSAMFDVAVLIEISA